MREKLDRVMDFLLTELLLLVCFPMIIAIALYCAIKMGLRLNRNKKSEEAAMSRVPVSTLAAGFSMLCMVASLFFPWANLDKLVMILFIATACTFFIEAIVYNEDRKYFFAVVFMAFTVLQHLKI